LHQKVTEKNLKIRLSSFDNNNSHVIKYKAVSGCLKIDCGGDGKVKLASPKQHVKVKYVTEFVDLPLPLFV
jgi:hypothetical protein